ncbi:hypothetical protein CRG98_015571 [Punica granatum]|uniref:Pentatricopeptide repeat-containing protein n=1 Tax=Punica granatum TaxID=22663 RepID=A0A2I0K659_PUNGR|nr:hypothetical protein CRG98_015571 [Punica granatum]
MTEVSADSNWSGGCNQGSHRRNRRSPNSRIPSILAMETTITAMEATIMELDVVAYTTVMDGLCKQGEIAKAYSLFNSMTYGGIRPDKITYSSMIYGLSCCAGRWKEVVVLLIKMASRGAEPDLISYTSLSHGLCHLQQTMIEGIKPDVVTYNSLIHALCTACQWEEVEVLLGEKSHRNIMPNVRTYTTLVDALCKDGQISKAEHVFDSMTQSGVEPDIFTYCSLINGYCLQDRLDAARVIFDLMVEMDCPANVVSYNSSLIGGFCCIGNIQAAVELLRDMESVGQCPDLQTYEILLNGLCETHNLDAATGLPRKMEDQKITNSWGCWSITGGIIMNPGIWSYEGLCKCGRLESAKKLFYALEERGLQPDVVTVISGTGAVDPSTLLTTSVFCV